MKSHQEFHFRTLTYQRGSHHNKETCKGFVFQTRQPGAPLKTTYSQLTMHITLHPCRMTTNRTLERTKKAIDQTTTPTTKKTKRLTTPKTPVKFPTPITPSLNTILDTSKRGSQVTVINSRINDLSSAKMSVAWEVGMKTSWKNHINSY